MAHIHLHLVSDSTGETVRHVARACLVQFEGAKATQHAWPMVRTEVQVREIVTTAREQGGIILFTFVDPSIRDCLQAECLDQQVPFISVLDPIISAFASFLGSDFHAEPGRQHAMDAEYFTRIEAMNFALAHDDGQMTQNLHKAEIVLVGVSRTSKTPTSMYIANRGIKTANVPMVPGCPLPRELFETTAPLIVGLIKDPKRLVQVRRQRLKFLNQDEETDYTDPEMVAREIRDATKLFMKQGWPTIDVTRKSIEETAATILQHHQRRLSGGGA
jgi:regulator of PEP synthase PpsR (kinase-PPPase family)